MHKTIIGAAAIMGLLSIILGAFGAHALKETLSPDQLVSFETGVRYQMYHALFLLFVGATSKISDKQKKTVFMLTLVGVIFFSVSIYLLSTKAVTGIDFSFLGPITPIGGLFLIIAWATLFFSVLRQKTMNN